MTVNWTSMRALPGLDLADTKPRERGGGVRCVMPWCELS